MLCGKLEALGYSVGHRLAERYTKDVAWLWSELDIMKFVCRELWLAVWGRRVDRLETNRQGVYVLHDQHFRPLQHIRLVHPTDSHNDGREREQLDEQARVYVAFSCGVLRGALMSLGVTAIVRADTVNEMGVTFTICDVERINRAQQQSQSGTSTTSSNSASSEG